MTLNLLLVLTGIGLVDSLNPSLFIVIFVLLTMSRPGARSAAFIAGVLVVNYAAGTLILGGMLTLLQSLLRSLDPVAFHTAQMVLGLGLVGFGVWYRATSLETEGRAPRSPRLWHAFALGMAVMLNELTTGLPYLFAIEQIASADVGPLASLLALAAYNAVFSLPLWAFLGMALAYRARFTAQLERINGWVRVWSPRMIKYGALGFGGLLAMNGAVFLIESASILQ